MSERLSDERRTGVRAAIDAWEMKGATSTTVALMADALYGAAQEIADARAEALRDFARKWADWTAQGAPQTRGGAAYRALCEAQAIESIAPARNPDRLDATETEEPK